MSRDPTPPTPPTRDPPVSGSGAAMPRRRFLAVAAAAVAAVAAGVAGLLSSGRGERSGGSPSPAGRLTDDELTQVAALAPVVFPPETDREARELEDEIRWWAGGRSTLGPYLDTYRDGIRALAAATAAAGLPGPFSELPAAERERVLASGLEGAPAAELAALIDELLEGIYSSTPGWRSLGYATWPGVPSPPLEYTRPPGRAPVGRPA